MNQPSAPTPIPLERFETEGGKKVKEKKLHDTRKYGEREIMQCLEKVENRKQICDGLNIDSRNHTDLST